MALAASDPTVSTALVTSSAAFTENLSISTVSETVEKPPDEVMNSGLTVPTGSATSSAAFTENVSMSTVSETVEKSSDAVMNSSPSIPIGPTTSSAWFINEQVGAALAPVATERTKLVDYSDSSDDCVPPSVDGDSDTSSVFPFPALRQAFKSVISCSSETDQTSACEVPGIENMYTVQQEDWRSCHDSDIDSVQPCRKKLGFSWPKTKRTRAYVIDSDTESDNEPSKNLVPDACKSSRTGRPTTTMNSEETNSKAVEEGTPAVLLTVPKSNRCSDKVFDKLYYCPICHISVVHLPRHLYSLHSDDRAVAEAISATGARKKQLLARLRNLGSHLHNQEVLRAKSGSLSVIYRPKKVKAVQETDYLPCMYCYGYLQKRQLWRHVRKCPLKPESSVSVKAVHAGKLLLENDQDVTNSVRELIANMRAGPEKLLMKNDRLLQAVAGKMLQRVNCDMHHTNNIRARLRKLCRVVLHMRKSNSALSNVNLREILTPKHFSSVISAVKAVAGHEGDNCLASPSVAVDLGRDLKKCAVKLKGMALEEGDREVAKNAKNFLARCTDEWNDEVSGGARRTLKRRKVNKTLLLPVASDVMKLNAHLQEVQKGSMASVQSPGKDDDSFSVAFRQLASTLLAQLILFNRRRPGEVSKLEIARYVENCEKKYISEDAVKSLSELEKQLLRNFTRIEVPGKRDNVVPILMTATQKAAIDLLVNAEHRSMAGIAQQNPYVFPASMGSMSSLRGNDCLRIFAKECGAKNPLQLKATELRKHVATFSQIINLKDNEMDQLAGFLGHNIRIHRDYYRLPLDVVQTAKVARILLAAEKGCISQYSGKTLDDIHISPDDG